MKITGGPWARGPYLEARAPRSTELGARQAPRNVRGLNIEIEKDFDISRPGPADSGEGPSMSQARGPTGSYKEEPYFHPCIIYMIYKGTNDILCQ